MAISWIAALKAVPWTEVIAATPRIVQGAEKLWGKVRQHPSSPDAEEGNASAGATANERMRAVEEELFELQQEVKVSSELIQSLAQQNLQLVKMVDHLRLRTHILFGICAVLALATALAYVGIFGG